MQLWQIIRTETFDVLMHNWFLTVVWCIEIWYYLLWMSSYASTSQLFVKHLLSLECLSWQKYNSSVYQIYLYVLVHLGQEALVIVDSTDHLMQLFSWFWVVAFILLSVFILGCRWHCWEKCDDHQALWSYLRSRDAARSCEWAEPCKCQSNCSVLNVHF